MEQTHEFQSYKQKVEELYHQDTKSFVKSIISLEYGIEDEVTLEKVYSDWLNTDNDNNSLLSDDINNLVFCMV